MNTKQKIILAVLAVIIIIEFVVIATVLKGTDKNYSTSSDQETVSSESSNSGTTSIDEDYPNLINLTYADFKEMNQSGKKSVVVIVQTTCGYCTQYKPIINEIASEEQLPVYVLDILKMSDSDITEFLGMFDYFTENPYWGTPLSLVIENGVVLDSLSGLASKEDTVKFYQGTGLIS